MFVNEWLFYGDGDDDDGDDGDNGDNDDDKDINHHYFWLERLSDHNQPKMPSNY